MKSHPRMVRIRSLNSNCACRALIRQYWPSGWPARPRWRGASRCSSLCSTFISTHPTRLCASGTFALRLRRVGSAAHPQWLQTLKTSTGERSALSQRGEWESEVPGPALDLAALARTPWTGIDPDGRLFVALASCFVTRFERTLWLVRRRDGSAVEVALDIGQVEADGKQAPFASLNLN